MEYKIFKYYWDTVQEEPKDFTLVYYDPCTKTIGYYSCSLIVSDNESFKLKGPDEKLKKKIAERFNDYGKQLIVEHSEYKDFDKGSMVLLMPTFVKFLDPLFPDALDDFVSNIAVGEDYYYASQSTDDEEFKKVNSIEDIKRLDSEYESRKAQVKLELGIKEKTNARRVDKFKDFITDKLSGKE